MTDPKGDQILVDHIAKWHVGLMVMAASFGPAWWYFERWAAPGVYFPWSMKIGSTVIFLITAFLCWVPKFRKHADVISLFTGLLWAGFCNFLVYRNSIHPYFVMIAGVSIASGATSYKKIATSSAYVLGTLVFGLAFFSWHWFYNPLPNMGLFLAAEVTILIVSFGNAYKQLDIEKELRRKHLDIEQKNRFIENVTSSVPEIICVLNVEQFAVTYLNEKSTKILGGSIDESKDFIRALYCRTFNGIEGPSIYQATAPDHRPLWVEVQWRDFESDQNGVVTQRLGVVRDITDQKIREEEREAQRLTMIQSARLSTLGEMAGGIAHEINNPLTIILGYADRLEDQAIWGQDMDQAAIRSHTDRIKKMAQRIAEIVRGLKYFSRDASGDPMSKVELSTVVEESVDLVKSRFEKAGVSLEVPEVSKSLFVMGRGVQISQILINLLANALDAVSDQKDPWVRILITESPERISIRIQDNGPKISKEVQDRMMNPFFTTKPVGQGTGLGLSISEGLARSHGAKLIFEMDTPTTFLLEFPRLTLSENLNEIPREKFVEVGLSHH